MADDFRLPAHTNKHPNDCNKWFLFSARLLSPLLLFLIPEGLSCFPLPLSVPSFLYLLVALASVRLIFRNRLKGLIRSDVNLICAQNISIPHTSSLCMRLAESNLCRVIYQERSLIIQPTKL